MSAEGGPNVLSSIFSRGMGVVIQYRCLDDSIIKGIETQDLGMEKHLKVAL